MTLKCASFFTGVGGIDIAFKQAGFETVYANEYDTNATATFEENFNLKVDVRDIRDVKSSQIPDFDIMLAGFPCQAFSIAGYRQGFDDKKGRGNLFFELERIFVEKKPQIIFLENVKNLVGHDNSNTFRVILKKLNHAGYKVRYQVLNSIHYGNIPQNRERIYIVAFLNDEQYHNFDFPDPIPLEAKLSDFIDFENKVDGKFYYTAEKHSFYNLLEFDMKNSNTVYQWRRKYVRENKSNVCPTLTANMGTGGHNVPLVLTKHGIRKLTPQECFLIQGFNTSFKLPENMSNTSLYKQSGNSVVVPVVERIAHKIKECLSNTTLKKGSSTYNNNRQK
jgi:DNA (cytosine-5)-methyltransferase 1